MSVHTHVEVWQSGNILLSINSTVSEQFFLTVHEAERLKSQLETAINEHRVNEPNKKWIGVDFDGTVAEYQYGDIHRHGHTFTGNPIPKMVARIRQWIEEGETVKIFTARIAEPIDPVELKETREIITDWLKTHVHPTYHFEITNVKDRDMKQLWDDRAVGVYVNTGQRVE